VAEALRCPRCGARKSWRLRDGRRRCADCRYDWKPGRLPLRLSLRQWRAVLRWFVRGASSAEIARETRLERKRVLRALMLVRRAILRTAAQRPRRTMVLSRTTRSATLGLRLIDGHVSAEVIPEAQADQLGRWLRQRTGRLPLALHPYAAVAYRGRLHRLHGPTARMPFGQVEAFWAALQRQLKATGGIRRERLALYLAAFAWRYNNRKLSREEQVNALLTLLRAAPSVA
jgi:transposase